jgi:uncharacterized membrane protein YfcA
MSPTLLLTLLLSSLLAIMPVRRLHQAGWSSGALTTAWVVYVGLLLAAVDSGAGLRYLLPVLVVLFVLPYLAGKSRLEKVGRLLGARRAAPARPVINVTPPDGAAAPQDEAPPPKRRGRKPPVEYR